MNRWVTYLVGVAAVLTLTACGDSEETVPGRWYTQSQVSAGKELFQANCGVCHGMEAEGTVADWRKTLADGSYPPPPLNGSAHAWHHPLSQLKRTIQQGGAPYGGKMPGFGRRLDDDQQLAAIAFFQSKWTAEIYAAWLARGGLN